MGNIEQRALAAYYRTGGTDQPTTPTIVTHLGLTYVVLHNVNGVLRVFRLKNDGTLKSLKRWPATLLEGITQ